MNIVSVKEERNSYCDNFLIIGDEVVGDGEEDFLVINDLQGCCKLSRDDDECSLASSFCSVTTDNEFQDGAQQSLLIGELVPSNESYFILSSPNDDPITNKNKPTDDEGTSNSNEELNSNDESCSNVTSTGLQEEVYEQHKETTSPMQNKHNEKSKGNWRKFFMDDLRLKDEAWTAPIPDMTPE